MQRDEKVKKWVQQRKTKGIDKSGQKKQNQGENKFIISLVDSQIFKILIGAMVLKIICFYSAFAMPLKKLNLVLILFNLKLKIQKQSV